MSHSPKENSTDSREAFRGTPYEFVNHAERPKVPRGKAIFPPTAQQRAAGTVYGQVSD